MRKLYAAIFSAAICLAVSGAPAWASEHQSTTDAQGVFSSVIDMPAGQGTLTLTFTVSSSGANNWTPTTSISDLLVVVMKKSTAGISIS